MANQSERALVLFAVLLLTSAGASCGAAPPRATDRLAQESAAAPGGSPSDAPSKARACAPGSFAPCGPAAREARAYKSVTIEGVPHVHQKPDFCGEACVEMFARKLGLPLSQDDVFTISGTDPALGRGVHTAELKTALERAGFDPGAVWSSINASSADAELTRQWDALYDDLSRGVPSIVCMHYNAEPGTTEHFRLVLGYDAAKDEVIYHEPAEAKGAYRRMGRGLFLRLWPLKYDPLRWTLIRLKLERSPGAPLNAPPEARESLSNAALAQHVLALRKKIGRGFTVVIERPFVVAGDGSPSAVKERGASVVRWAVKKLKDEYFSRDPEKILTIYLFKDKTSYRANTLALFGERPSTPYGYYSAKHEALIMDISTGGGTLVHEIVHPFIEANFPDCPPWFNEGLGSLYEQSGEEGGRIHGFTNWRLGGLKEAIRRGRVPPFRELMAADAHAFYEEDPGTNYAQSRYLLYYLQEKGLLARYYREFYEHRGDDPTGFESLRRVLGETDMDAFKKRWEGFVMGLSFP